MFGLAEPRALAIKAMVMKIHGGAAMASLVLIGSLMTEHIPSGWRGERNKVSGVSTLALFCVLGISGYVLYYAGGEVFRTVTSYVHLGTGIALLVPVIAHVTGKAG